MAPLRARPTGSDFPYARPGQLYNFKLDLDEYNMPEELRRKIHYKNAISLIPRLQANMEAKM